MFFDISNIPFWISCRSGPPVPTLHLDVCLLGPTIFWVSNLEFHVLFDTSLSRVVGQECSFCAFSFAVPSTTKSLLSDDVVRDLREHPIAIGENFGWICFLPRDVHKCNRSLHDSKKRRHSLCQSWNSEVNFVLLFAIFQCGSHRTCLIFFNMCRCQNATLCRFWPTNGSHCTC